MGSIDYKFEGWLGLDKESVKGKMVWQEYQPKPFTDDDIDIKITHAGICGSDLHTLRAGWYPTNYPVCVGHEIVGTAVKVGKNNEGIKVGDRVGVGAQSASCLKPDCEDCSNGLENHCGNPGAVNTYDGKYPDGSKSYGGYADYSRVPSHFCFKIPDALSSEEAAPMMCGGVTVYSPLKNYGAGPGKRVGIVGIGGLGHFGIMFSKALGAETVAISRSSSKKDDALKMGAVDFIATDEDKDWATKNSKTLDLIVCTVSSSSLPLEQYLQLLKTKGTFIQVGAPEEPLPSIRPFALLQKGVKIGGSAIGAPAEIREMLQVAADKGVHTWSNPRPLKDANKAVIDMDAGKARYRYVLVNEKHAKL